MRGLSGRRAVVTGAARGIGFAIAERLLAEGVAVALADVDRAAAEAAAARLDSCPLPLELDVSDPASVDAGLGTAVDRLGGLDILVNNVGILRDRRLEEMSDTDWSAVLEVGLGGAFHCARAALGALRTSPAGRIINISSRAHLGNPGQANYSAAKAGLIGLTRALAMELGRDGISVNAVAPGMIATDLVLSHPKAEALIERAVKATPLRRVGEPADVAGAVAFLASDDGAYVSGEVLHVTGGRY